MKTLLLLAAVGLFGSMQAQNPIGHMDVYVQSHLEETTVNSEIILAPVQEPQMFIALSDTNNVSSFIVKLGTTEGGNDIFQKTFIYNTTGIFEDGTSYTRDGAYVRLNLGKYATLTTYHAQVKAVVNGTEQTAVTFSGQ